MLFCCLGVTLRLSVINKIKWCMAVRRPSPASNKLRRLSAITDTPPLKCWRHATVQQWSMQKPDICRKSRFLLQLVGPRSEYCHNVWYGKMWMMWLPGGKTFLKISVFVSTNAWTWRTPVRTDGQTLRDSIGCAYVQHRAAEILGAVQENKLKKFRWVTIKTDDVKWVVFTTLCCQLKLLFVATSYHSTALLLSPDRVTARSLAGSSSSSSSPAFLPSSGD